MNRDADGVTTKATENSVANFLQTPSPSSLTAAQLLECLHPEQLADRYYNEHCHGLATWSLLRRHHSRHAGRSCHHSRRRSILGTSLNEKLSNSALVTFTNSSFLCNSLLPMRNSSNGSLACNLFKDIHRIMHGTCGHDEVELIRHCLGLVQPNGELRDEFFVQLMRQLRGCPNFEWSQRIWTLLQLATQTITISRTVRECIICWLEDLSTEMDELALATVNENEVTKKPLMFPIEPQHTKFLAGAVKTCLQNLRRVTKQVLREFPASSLEIQSCLRQTPVLCRISYSDGHQRILSLDQWDTMNDLCVKAAKKVGLTDSHRWHLIPEYNGENLSVRYSGRMFVLDAISDYEQRISHFNGSKCGQNTRNRVFYRPTLVSRSKNGSTTSYLAASTLLKFAVSTGTTSGISETTSIMPIKILETTSALIRSQNELKNEFIIPVFKFQIRIIPLLMFNPQLCHVEVNLLYHQVQQDLVKLSQPIVDKATALILAGTQAYVTWGKYDESKFSRYTDVSAYISEHLLKVENTINNSTADINSATSCDHCPNCNCPWSLLIAQKHKLYSGYDWTREEAQRYYLTQLEKYPSYGYSYFLAKAMSFDEKPHRVKFGVGPHGVRIVAVNGNHVEGETCEHSENLPFLSHSALVSWRASLKSCTCSAASVTAINKYQNSLSNYAASRLASKKSGTTCAKCEQHQQQSFTYDQINSIEMNGTEEMESAAQTPYQKEATLTMELSLDSGARPKRQLYQLSLEDQYESSTQLNSYIEQRQGGFMQQANQMLLLRMARFTEEDRLRLQEEITDCRRTFVEQRLLARPADETSFLKNTFRRFSKTKPDRDSTSNNCADRSAFKSSFWSYTKLPIRQPLLALRNEDLDRVALKMFNSILLFSQFETSEAGAEEDVTMIQALIQKCLENKDLCNEFYLQIIKQTTDHSDPNHIVNLRNWQVLSVACNFVIPSREIILRYLRAHLRKCSIDTMSEEGRYAQYCQKCLNKTLEKTARRYPPCSTEIRSIFTRHSATENVQLLSGGQRSVEFSSHSTTEEVLKMTKGKVGMLGDARGWALFECFGFIERSMNLQEYFGDVLFKWEQYARRQNVNNEFKIVLKKRLIIDPVVNQDDEIEVDLFAHQCVTSVFEGKIPLDIQLATELCGIRAAAESVDAQAAMRILPHSWRDKVSQKAVADVAQQHSSMPTCTSADTHRLHAAFISTCQKWQYFGAALYDVELHSSSTMSDAAQTDNLLLAVDQHGLHLVRYYEERVSHNLECLYSNQYSQISSFNTEARYFLTVFFNTSSIEMKMVFFTKQATNIAYLIRDYMKELRILPDSGLGHTIDLQRRKRSQLKSLDNSNALDNSNGSNANFSFTRLVKKQSQNKLLGHKVRHPSYNTIATTVQINSTDTDAAFVLHNSGSIVNLHPLTENPDIEVEERAHSSVSLLTIPVPPMFNSSSSTSSDASIAPSHGSTCTKICLNDENVNINCNEVESSHTFLAPSSTNYVTQTSTTNIVDEAIHNHNNNSYTNTNGVTSSSDNYLTKHSSGMICTPKKERSLNEHQSSAPGHTFRNYTGRLETAL